VLRAADLLLLICLTRPATVPSRSPSGMAQSQFGKNIRLLKTRMYPGGERISAIRLAVLMQYQSARQKDRFTILTF